MILKVFRFLSFLVLANVIVTCSLFATEVVELEDATPVILRLTEEVSTKTKHVNDVVHLVVAKDVVVDGKVVIKSGTAAQGVVSICEKEDILGQEGTIAICVNSTAAVDGQWVYLRANLTREGQNKELLSAGAAYACCPVFGLIKGEKANFPQGTEIKAYTENDMNILVN